MEKMIQLRCVKPEGAVWVPSLLKAVRRGDEFELPEDEARKVVGAEIVYAADAGNLDLMEKVLASGIDVVALNRFIEGGGDLNALLEHEAEFRPGGPSAEIRAANVGAEAGATFAEFAPFGDATEPMMKLAAATGEWEDFVDASIAVAVAKDFGVAESTFRGWLKDGEVYGSEKSGRAWNVKREGFIARVAAFVLTFGGEQE